MLRLLVNDDTVSAVWNSLNTCLFSPYEVCPVNTYTWRKISYLKNQSECSVSGKFVSKRLSSLPSAVANSGGDILKDDCGMKTVMTWPYINRDYRSLSHNMTLSYCGGDCVEKKVQLNMYRPH